MIINAIRSPKNNESARDIRRDGEDHGGPYYTAVLPPPRSSSTVGTAATPVAAAAARGHGQSRRPSQKAVQFESHARGPPQGAPSLIYLRDRALTVNDDVPRSAARSRTHIAARASARWRSRCVQRPHTVRLGCTARTNRTAAEQRRRAAQARPAAPPAGASLRESARAHVTARTRLRAAHTIPQNREPARDVSGLRAKEHDE